LFHLLSLCLLLVFTASLPAAETNGVATRVITLQECYDLALRENLDLSIERLNPTLSRLDLELARSVYDPLFNSAYNHNEADIGPTINQSDTVSAGVSGSLAPTGLRYDLSGNAIDNHVSAAGSAGLTLSQPLLRNFLIDNPRYRIALARKDITVSELRLRDQIIDILTRVEKAYYDLIFRREDLKVKAEGLRLAERLVTDDHRRAEIGMIPRLDVRKSESEAAARLTELISAQSAEVGAQNELKRLITSDYRKLHDIDLVPPAILGVEPHPFDLHDSWEKGLANRPDLLQAKVALERQGITLKYYRNQRLPALDVAGSYGHTSGGFEFNDTLRELRKSDREFWSVGAAFSIPLGNKNAREQYRRGKVEADQLVLQLKKLEETVLVEVDEAMSALRTSRERIQSSTVARGYAEEALTAEQKKLDSGKSTSYDVLQFQRDLISARTSEIQALSDYNKALADLYQAEGTTLERKRIKVETK